MLASSLLILTVLDPETADRLFGTIAGLLADEDVAARHTDMPNVGKTMKARDRYRPGQG
ncbi:MAG: hypothetical protein AAFX39_15730 [Pseudomonadota bacterium]